MSLFKNYIAKKIDERLLELAKVKPKKRSYTLEKKKEEDVRTPITWKELGSYITRMRSRNKLIQKELADKLNMSTSQLSRIERGEKPVSYDTACAIDDAIGTNAKQLWSFPYFKPLKETK